MRTLSIFAVAATMLAVSGASAQTIVEKWVVKESAPGSNTWLDDTIASRGIDFIPAASNTFAEDIIVVNSGQAATQTVRILAADDGAALGSFSLVSAGGGAVPTYRLATSDDGKVFVNGFDGAVTMSSDLTGATITTVVAESAVTGNSRALDVVGSVTARTAYIFVTGGSTVYIFTNDPGQGSSGETNFVPATVPSVLTAQAELDYISALSSSEFYVGDASPGDIQRFSLSAGVWTGDTALTAYAAFAIQGIAVGAGYVAIAESGGAEDGYGLADLATQTNITPAVGLDGDGDNVYDAGTGLVLNGTNATADVAFDAVTKTVYGISLGGANVAAENAIIAIQLQPASVSDWTMY